MLPSAGDIWVNERHHQDPDTGTWQRKHILILAVDLKQGFIVYRPFTSKGGGRSKAPACGVGPPVSSHPAFYVGQGLVPVLPLDTWVDLYFHDDIDSYDWARLVGTGVLKFEGNLPFPVFCMVLSCASSAGVRDTTRYQCDQMKDTRAALRCPP